MTAFNERVSRIQAQDRNQLAVKDKSYGSSWRKRGGPQAFAVIARKWDRIEAMCEPNYDIFKAFKEHDNFADQVGDLRRYLLLLEEYCTREEDVKEPGTEPETYGYVDQD